MLAPSFIAFIAAQAGPCIAIDPGHGGPRDDGTTSLEFKEKHLTMIYARALVEALQSELPGYRALLTREDDRELGLQERARIANSAACRVLVSLHVNGSVEARMNGLETYYLSTLKARLPRRLKEIAKDSDDVTLIARELKARVLAERSAALAELVNETTIQAAHTLAPEVRTNGTRHDLLLLLLGAEMPSVLVEVGYLSSPMERAHLIDSRYQRALAHGIAAGVKAFLGE